MKPIVIFEGPDGGGKTTAARAVAKRLGAMYVHHGSYDGLSGNQLALVYHDSMLPALDGSAPVVLDRCWLSEPIYGEVFRLGTDRLSVAHRRMLTRVLLSTPHLVIQMTAPFEELWRVVSERAGEELAKRREQLERVVAAYERAPVGLVRDRTRCSVADVVELVWVQEVAPIDVASQAYALRCAGVIGNVFEPDRCVLLVGDQASQRSTTQLPFVNHTLGGCSAWLTERLEEYGVGEERLCWANAYDPAGELTDLQTAAIGALSWRGVVALGQNAASVLGSWNISHLTVRHPQHVKRFNYNNTESWNLREILKEMLS